MNMERRTGREGKVKQRLRGVPIYYTAQLLDSRKLRQNVEMYLNVGDERTRKKVLGRPSHRLPLIPYNHPYHRETNVMTDSDLVNEAIHLIGNRILVIRFVADGITTQNDRKDTLIKGGRKLTPMIEYREGNDHKIVHLSKAQQQFRDSTFTFRNRDIRWYPYWEELIRNRVLNEIPI